MSTTAVNPICAKCGTEIIWDDGGMVMSGKRYYHNTCAPDYRAVTPSPSPDEPPEMQLLRGPMSRRATSAEFNEWQAREIVAYVDRLRAELDEMLKELRCPIGLDASQNICSAGTCKACWGAQAKHYHERTKAAEAALASMREALTDLVAECEEYARINHLHNDDGSPATTGAMKHAYAILRSSQDTK